MRRIVLFAAGLFASAQGALAADVGGNAAISLAALVGEHSPFPHEPSKRCSTLISTAARRRRSRRARPLPSRRTG